MPCFVNLFRLLTIFIIHGVSSLLDLEELANIQYAIDILDKPMILNGNEMTDGVILSSRYGQLYQCQYEAVASGDSTGQEGEDYGGKAEVIDLLKPMEDEPCLIQTTGWWTYELCYKKEIKQYHLEEGKISGDVISLGRFTSEFNWNDVNLKSKPEYAGRYHSQEYRNGSLCDLTDELRSTSVRFKCHNSVHDGIEGIEEPTTCTYIITVHTNKICQRPELKILSQKKSVPITCQPLLNEEEFSDYAEFHTKHAAQSDDTETLPELNRETTSQQPGTSISRADSFFVMAETTDDLIDDDDDDDTNDEFKRVLVGTIVKKLKNSLDSEKSEQDEEEDEDGLKTEQKDKMLNTESQIDESQQLTQDEEKPGEENVKIRKGVSTKLSRQKADASNELKSALEGILTAVNSELKTLTNGNDEEEEGDEEEEEREDVVQQRKENKEGSSTHKENENKEPDVSGSSSESEVTGSKKTDETTSDEEVTGTAVEGSYITWQGRGNQIQQITIDTGMKARVKQVDKKDREQKEDDENLDRTDSDSDELKKTKSTAPPARKVEVRIINAAYYNKDGRPVSVYAGDTNPSIERMVIALLQRNDDEVAEFEKQKRIEENYQFKWSKTKKETKATVIDDQPD